MIRFIKRNNILLAFLAIYALMVGLVLVELDKQNYQSRKRDLILEDPKHYVFHAIGDPLRNRVNDLALTELETHNPRNRDALLALIQDFLNGENPIYRIAIQTSAQPGGASPGGEAATPGGKLIVDESNPEKLKDYNHFANSLFFRDFSGQVSMDLSPAADAASTATAVMGRLLVFYTTPRNAPAIEELTTLYRWYAVFIVGILSLLAVLVMRTLLLPLRQVTIALESATASRMRFVQRPRSRIETLYNRMALDAVVARLHGQMRDAISQQPQLTAWEVVERACRSFCQQVNLPLVACLEIAAEGPGQLRLTGLVTLAGREEFLEDREQLVQQIDEALPRDARREFDAQLAVATTQLDAALHLMPDPNRLGIRYLFAVANTPRGEESGYASLQNMIESLVDLVGTGLQTLALRNQLLVQERGRANISLSRNLGHDLTNIIATSKLDLMALDRLLHDGRGPQDEVRRVMLIESLGSLMQSVRFMQETVNLYRAYAFLQHPVLETHDANKLVGETLDLFMMSISGKIQIVRELAGDAPRCMVDARLLKLALFNLFVNALEAIRKSEDDEPARGWIKVATRRAPSGGLTIAIDDSGPGILSPLGERAQPHEIEKIFELGYTSQRSGANHKEGLGLNWVRTIVHDLHGGTIRAENIAGGGARFILTFPPLETTPSPSEPRAAS